MTRRGNSSRASVSDAAVANAAAPRRPTNGGKRPLGDKLRAAVDEVHRIYSDLAQRPIERDCVRRTECCHFKLTGRTPYLTKGEALVAAKALRATGRKSLPKRADGACSLLGADGNCLIYEARPFGCRTHFCAAAGGPYSRSEVVDLIHRLEAIDNQLGGKGARPLPDAVTQALEELR